jgi:lipid A 4'-phosphatase
VALVPTIWSALDLAGAALFYGKSAVLNANYWWWVQLINLYTPVVFRTFVLLALAGWIFVSLRSGYAQWRLRLAFVVLAGTLGPGLLVNNGFKDYWQRGMWPAVFSLGV